MSMFQKSVINKYSKTLNEGWVSAAYHKFKEYYGDQARIVNIKSLNEENYQEGFLKEIFDKVLGYTLNPDVDFNLTTEYKNETDSKKADGAILKEGKAIAVIELKSTKTKKMESIREQAFNYKNNQSACRYVITSNFEKIRFYIENATEHEEFNLFDMDKEQFKRLYLILNKDSILEDLPLKLKEDSKLHEQNISKKLYNDYSNFKRKIFDNLVKNNQEYDKLTLLKKSQKLLDRFLFIFFAEDCGLLPPNIVSKIIDDYNKLKDMDEYRPLYNIYCKYFKYIDEGKVDNKIPAYNGELFKPDEILNAVKIDDEILTEDTRRLSGYDFETDVSVNILGHVFEHSLTEIEELNAEISGEIFEKKKTKRKKEGVFYTPKYITKYIIDNTLGVICAEKKKELNLLDFELDESMIDSKKKKLKKAEKDLLNRLLQYRDYLLSLKILDPACGSGAFLNQALEFFLEEHSWIDENRQILQRDALGLENIENSILENNLYGVDINEEAVEIAKLSLWLRTAHQGRKLYDLSNNIKCGNSLIDDPSVAGDKAFNWEQEFSKIMKAGGFDVVIGNPPYGAEIRDKEKIFYQMYYQYFQGNYEIYFFFIENCKKLLKENGKLGFITPDTWINIPQAQKLREDVLRNYGIQRIISFGYSVFQDVGVNPIIFILFLNSLNKKCDIASIETQGDIVKLYDDSNYYSCDIGKWEESEDKQFQIWQRAEDIKIIDKILLNSLFGVELLDVCQGIVPYSKENLSTEEIKNRIYHSNNKKNHDYGKWVQGRAVNRYSLSTLNHEYLNYGDWLHRARKIKYFKGERILIQEITGGHPPRLSATKYNDILYHDPGIISCLNISDKKTNYILAIINSKLISWYHRISSPKGKRNTFPKVLIGDIRKFPIKDASREFQDSIVLLVDSMLISKESFLKEQTDFLEWVKLEYSIGKLSRKIESFYELDFNTMQKEIKKNVTKGITFSPREIGNLKKYFDEYKEKLLPIKIKIDKTDTEIDRMVYDLYELTEEEIKIVEEPV